MLFNEASKRYFKTMSKRTESVDTGYSDVIAEMKALNAMPMLHDDQDLNLEDNELPLGFNSHRQLLTINIERHPRWEISVYKLAYQLSSLAP
jgi:hypothetical protein